MSKITIKDQAEERLILVLGATGKTGRRILERLEAKGLPTRKGSRSAFPSFDWNNESNWDECLSGVEAAYINYAPDLAIPGATDAIQAFVGRAKQHGVKRLVLLSGRGEEEAQACERIVQNSGVDWTVVRASWFNQNFSEGAFVEMVQAGQITLPAVDTPEPFVDVDDIADVAVAALTEPGHAGEVYEVTGPRLLTLARQGHLYLEDAVPGWDNTGSTRTGGFHRTVGSAGSQAPRQSNPLSWGTRSKSSLARAGYAGKARQRCEAPPQQGSSFTC